MDADEAQFMAAVRSGVIGYLLKDAFISDVVAAVRAVFRGEALPSFAPRYSATSLKWPGRCLSQPQLQGLILLCGNSNWSHSSPKVSQIKKSLLT